MKTFVAALASVFLLTGCDSPRPPWSDGRIVTEQRQGDRPQDLSGLENRLLALHNRERSATGARPLTWDQGLAKAAAAYGPALARLGKLAHSPAASRPGQGENLWMGTRDAYALEEMAGGWAAEKSLFRPGVFPGGVSRSGHWSDVGHYTQMIWKGTTHVGCTVHKTRRWDFLICRYSPPGNVVGRRVP